MMQPTGPQHGYQFLQEVKDSTSAEMLALLPRRVKNLRRAHRSGDARRMRIEAEELAALIIELRNRCDMLEQMQGDTIV